MLKFLSLLMLCSPAAAQNCVQSSAIVEAQAGARAVEAGDFEGAAAAFGRAVELDPSCLDYRTQKAAALERSELPGEAAAELEVVLKGVQFSARLDSEELDEIAEAVKALRRVSGQSAADKAARAFGTTCLSGRTQYDPAQVLFTFMQITDLHTGERMDGGSNDTKNLAWMTDKAYPAIKPAFMVATGDLTDSTNGFVIPLFGPHEKEWKAYSSAVSALPRGVYHDVPGNHDHYNDKEFRFYLSHSVSGLLQHSWTVTAGGGIYQFIAVNTAGRDGLSWPWDHRGLDEGELNWLAAEIKPAARRLFIFGHHPASKLEYGRDRFMTILQRTKASYFFGHTHDSSISVADGRLEVNVESLGKDSLNNYALVAVLNDNDVCVRLLDVGKLP